MWQWDTNAYSYPQSGIMDNLSLEGGWIETEPNPEYERWLKRRNSVLWLWG